MGGGDGGGLKTLIRAIGHSSATKPNVVLGPQFCLVFGFLRSRVSGSPEYVFLWTCARSLGLRGGERRGLASRSTWHATQMFDSQGAWVKTELHQKFLLQIACAMIFVPIIIDFVWIPGRDPLSEGHHGHLMQRRSFGDVGKEQAAIKKVNMGNAHF